MITGKVKVVTTVQKGRCAVATCHLSSGTVLLEELPFVGVNSFPIGSGIFPSHQELMMLLDSGATTHITDILQSCVLTIRLLTKLSSNQDIAIDLKSLSRSRTSRLQSDTDEVGRIAAVVHAYFQGKIPMAKCRVHSDIILRNTFTISEAELR